MTAEAQLWDICKKRIVKNKEDQDRLDEQYVEYRELVKGINKTLIEFRKSLLTLPLPVAFRTWVASTKSKKKAQERLKQMLLLFDSRVFFLKETRQALTLGDLESGGQAVHRYIIETIRCSSDWSIKEKEKLVLDYIEFGTFLSEDTNGLIIKPVDPDRESVTHKVLDYDLFLEFSQELPERNSLIAQLLYFGASSVEDVISLKYRMVKKRKNAIQYSKYSVIYPQHVIEAVLRYTGRKEGKEFVFLNYRNNPVERSHISQNFKRVSENMIGGKTITPRTLLEAKTSLS
ncbi:hypothetical protein SCG7109_AB_00280 [Chlamydiales bacterium SCGC AG-110-M15]|nr:hypothetical protein SCG7109_AB_00280 [Chlamydiales bacterium SCGC AG-110-M15]